MDLSIIIPTFNNAEMLATTLSAFEHVQFPEAVELIVVDNNSTDNTAETIKGFSDRLPIRYAFEGKQGVAAAKNRGMREAIGDLLVFTDDDVRPCPNWIMTYLVAYKRYTKGVFWGGPIVSEFEGQVPEDRLLRFAPPSVKGLDFGEQPRFLGLNESFVSANFALSSQAFEDVGGYDTRLGLDPTVGIVLGGEEIDLQRRLKSAGYRARYLPSASIRHVVPRDKCTLNHLADRAEASGRYTREITFPDPNEKSFRGVPLWRYRKCAERWGAAWIKRITGRNWYPDYISYRADLGFIKGLPDGHSDDSR